MVSRIREVMMKKIWRIPLFLLIIISLVVSIIIAAVTYTPRVPSTTPVVLGTGHLIDGYHVAYAKDLEARWTAQKFWLHSDGKFLIDLQCDYISEDPRVSKIYFSHDNTSTVEVDFEYVGSVILLVVTATYRDEPFGDFAHEDLTDIIPIVANSVNSRLCFATYEEKFDLPIKKKGMSLYGIELKISWIRVFREKNDGELYYQWMQGDSDVWGGEELEVDKTYNNFSGGFLVYYPIPENMTSPVPLNFNYVKWIRENM